MKIKKIISSVVATTFLLNTVFATTIISVKDMPTGWSNDAVNSALQNNVLSVEEGYVRPGELLTRAEMALGINNIFGTKDKADLSKYTDVSKEKWYYDEMAKAVEMGLFSGYGNGLLKPEKNITREEMFTAIFNVLALEKGAVSHLAKFNDRDLISDWAKGIVARMAQDKYVSGNLLGNVKPLDPITREEFAQVIKNIFAMYCSSPDTYTDLPVGNIIVSSPDVILKNTTIIGDLIITEGVGEGTVILDNVIVDGRIYARSGQNIKLINNSKVEEKLIISNPKGVTNIYTDKSEIKKVDINTNVSIEGDYQEIAVKGTAELEIKGTVKEIVVDETSQIKVSKSNVETITVNSTGNGTKISGNGKITEVNANANNVEVSTEGTKVTAGINTTGVKAGKKEVAPGETVVVKSSSGGGGSGGGSSSGSCNHKWQTTAVATCTTAEIETCSKCKQTQEGDPALGHTWVETTPATCITGKVETCEVCKETQVGETLDHTWIETTSATCTTGKIEMCETCKETKIGEAPGHSYDENEVCSVCGNSKKGNCEHLWVVVSPATCSTYEILQCEFCEELKEGQSALDHEWDTLVPVGCTTNEIEQCKLCKTTRYGETAYGHDWITTVDATCTVAKQEICNNCKDTRTLTALGHEWEITSPTCTENGKKDCSRCDETEVLDKLGHDWVTTEATCIEVEYDTCSRCNEVEERGPKLGHIWQTKTIATCESPEEQQCSRCEETQTVGKELGHAWEKIVDATCDNAEEQQCSRCEKTQTVGTTLEHEWETTKNATCVELEEQTCKLCEKTQKVGNLLDHDWKFETAATCIKLEVQKCSMCNQTKEVGELLEHTWKISYEPTCNEAGEKYCEVCYKTEEIAALEHNWQTKTEATCTIPKIEECINKYCEEEREVGTELGHDYKVTTEATCTIEEVKTCTRCDDELIGTALGHDEVTIEATCTQIGIIVCVRCKESETIEATGHEWGETVDATCTTVSHKECSVCHMVEYEGVALGHDYDEEGKCSRCNEMAAEICVHNWVEKVANTCTTAAIEECSKCLKTRDGESATNHNWKKYIDVTCETTQIDICNNEGCGQLRTNGEPLGHEWKITAPTCIEAGYTECLNCHIIKDIIEATGHSIGEDNICTNCGKTLQSICTHETYETVSPSTCTQAEIEACTVCDIERIGDPAIGHIYSVTRIPTCTMVGEETCKLCFATRDIGTISEHDWVTTTPATCETVAIQTCSKCKQTQNGASLGHLWNVVIDATCIEDETITCSRCGMSKEGENALGHNMVVTIAATCTTTGLEECSRCDEEGILDELGHDIITASPTCTEDGSETCSRCEYIKVLDKLGHDFIIEEPSCEKTGIKVCNRCGYTETIAANGHIWGDVTAAKCTTPAYKTCAVDGCGMTMIVENALGHSYDENGICKRCGTELADNCEHDWKETVAETCTTSAVETCTKCPAVQDGDEALGHNWKTVSDATCTSAEVQQCTRKDCGATQTIEGLADHDWIEKEATCIEIGYTKCNDCGEIKDIKEAKGHTLDGIGTCTVCNNNFCEHATWEVITEPTCIEVGKEKCTVCSLERETMPNGHNYIYIIGSATCTVYGKEKCSECSVTRDVETLLDHAWVTTNAATCSTAAKQTCSNCGATQSYGSTLSHKWEFYTAAECKKDGTRSCGVCGTTEVNPDDPQIGHDFENGTVINPATCTREGEIKCANCPEKYYPEPLGHDFSIEERKKTCALSGKYKCSHDGCTEKLTIPAGHVKGELVYEGSCNDYPEYLCSDCGEVYEEQTELGHKWKKLQDSTCSEKSVYYCENCPETKHGDEPLKEHTMVSKVGTCLERYRDECSVCGYTENIGEYGTHNWENISDLTCTTPEIEECSICHIQETVTEAPGHKFEDGKCTECNAPAKFIITFDATTNGGTLIGNETEEVNNGSAFEGELPTAEKEGYTFIGWYTEVEGGEEFDISEVLESDITVYAQFSEVVSE